MGSQKPLALPWIVCSMEGPTVSANPYLNRQLRAERPRGTAAASLGRLSTGDPPASRRARKYCSFRAQREHGINHGARRPGRKQAMSATPESTRAEPRKQGGARPGSAGPGGPGSRGGSSLGRHETRLSDGPLSQGSLSDGPAGTDAFGILKHGSEDRVLDPAPDRLPQDRLHRDE